MNLQTHLLDNYNDDDDDDNGNNHGNKYRKNRHLFMSQSQS
jgi:hypothetical protein